MKAWRQHWDHQLYKALEHQYQMGLEALNENLPEISIDLTFKQGRLQFKPPYEEIRAKYYRDMKRFISIPNQFRGLSEPGAEPIFSVMPERNANGFITVFSKAEDLFRRLSAVMDRFQEWVVLGQVDVDALIEKNLHDVFDWEKNFKALKVKGKDVERLPRGDKVRLRRSRGVKTRRGRHRKKMGGPGPDRSGNAPGVIKIDCLTINCSPVKAVIDDLIQKLFDSLLISLKKSIQAFSDYLRPSPNL
ncbi:unnamed protein product [Ranitomeya imitator]|uniref:Uncharacterized protein n=1 Tax=Ranitomeya imitator TaxID=111125 RepID=A0ABN9LG42_9NEOB|nr:unnamed protein product [Ranitomeya imitator]